MTEASCSAWLAPHVVAAAVASVTAATLFAPRELLHNRRYVLLAGMAFMVAASDLVVVVGVPLALVGEGSATVTQVGFTLLPSALVGILLTPLAGRLVDRMGALLPITTGIVVMLAGTRLLSVTAVVPLPVAAALTTVRAAGLAFVGSPLIAKVSLVVKSRVLATATGLTEMSFYLGAGFGTALLSAVLAAREGARRALDPLHTGAAPAYSDAFLIASLPLLAALLLSRALARSER